MKNSTPTTKTFSKKIPQKHIVNVLKKDNGMRKVKKVVQSFAQAVKEINDPRTSEGAIQYPLDEILFTALAAVICGSGSYYDFETFEKNKSQRECRVETSSLYTCKKDNTSPSMEKPLVVVTKSKDNVCSMSCLLGIPTMASLSDNLLRKNNFTGAPLIEGHR